MKCLFLYNGASGKGNISRKLPRIKRALEERFGEAELLETQSAEETERLVRERGEGYAAVVFAGGDGTFHRVVQGAAEREIALGYLPAGTVNDAARALGIPRRLGGALAVLRKGRVSEIDCLHVNDRYAVYLAAAGSVTRVSYETPQRQKRMFGWLAYAAFVLRLLRKTTPFSAEVSCGETSVKGKFALLFVMNGTSVAGLRVNRGASMRDGLCEIALVRQFGEGALARAGARWGIVRLMLFGTRRSGKRIVKMRGDRVRVARSEGVVWDLDGEKGAEGDAEIAVVSGAVKIILPRK